MKIMTNYRLTTALLRRLMAVPMDRAIWEGAAGDRLRACIANGPPLLDRRSALDGVAAFLARLETVGAGFWAAWRLEEAVFAECDLSFRNATGELAAIPCTIVARLANDELIDFRLHCDPSPLPLQPSRNLDYKARSDSERSAGSPTQ